MILRCFCGGTDRFNGLLDGRPRSLRRFRQVYRSEDLGSLGVGPIEPPPRYAHVPQSGVRVVRHDGWIMLRAATSPLTVTDGRGWTITVEAARNPGRPAVGRPTRSCPSAVYGGHAQQRHRDDCGGQQKDPPNAPRGCTYSWGHHAISLDNPGPARVPVRPVRMERPTHTGTVGYAQAR
jgi:hypothetical protein